MPSIKWIDYAGALGSLVSGFARFYTGLCVLGGKIGLGLLVLTGEMLALQTHLQPWVPVQLLRNTHALAGLILILAMVFQMSRFIAWVWLRYLKPLLPGAVGRTAIQPRKFSKVGMLDASFWAVSLLMVLSGLERFVRLEFEVAFLPLFPALWWPLHSTLRLFWYALFLLFFVIYGKIWTKRALYYLRSP